jgi:serine/threonine protein kinase
MVAIQALKAVHDCGILHGDIRPSNIMVCGDRLCLLDFGFARKISSRGSSSYGDSPVDEVRQLQELWQELRPTDEGQTQVKLPSTGLALGITA